MADNAIIKILTALLKHQVKKAVGEEALGVIGQEIVTIGGDQVDYQIKSWLEEKANAEDLEKAAQYAHDCFHERVGDRKLEQWMVSLPLGDLPRVAEALEKLPTSPDERQLEYALRESVANSWKRLTPQKVDHAVHSFMSCLRSALLPIKKHTLMVIGRSVLRTESKVDFLISQFEKYVIAGKSVTARFTIPAPVIDFTGREEELTELKSLFARGALIMGVSGGGGIGKTELARRLAQDVAHNFPDAQMNIDLLGTRQNPLSSEEAMRRLLEPFLQEGEKLPDDFDSLQGVFQDKFSKHKALLLLDNAADASQVRALIPPAPSAAILTSRQHFSLSEYGLDKPLRLDVLPSDESRSLLHKASSKLDYASDSELDDLAKLCGRLPLALRIAASLLNDRDDWTLSTLQKRLTDERTRLGRLKREDDKDLDIEATISLSYNLLAADLQQKFRALGIFPAPFWKNSVAAVWDMSEEEADELVGKLVNRSLLKIRLITVVDNSSLYELHDLTRLYAADRLREHVAEAQQVVTRHAEHFLAAATASDDDFLKGGENIIASLDRFRTIWPHLQSSWKRLLPDSDNWPHPQMSDQWLSNFPTMCINVLDIYLPAREKIPLLVTALEAARRLGDISNEGKHLGNLGNLYLYLGDAHKAIDFFEQALIIARKIENHGLEAGWLGSIGNGYAMLGNSRRAIEFYEQALALAREGNNRRSEGKAHINLGNAYLGLGDIFKAIEYYERARMLTHEIGDKQVESGILLNLGNAYTALGNARKAIDVLEQALLISQEIGDRRSEGYLLGNLGTAHLALGDGHKAIDLLEQALLISQEIDDRHAEGIVLVSLGRAYMAIDDNVKAIYLLEKATIISREIGDRRAEASALGTLGGAYIAIDDTVKAINVLEQARIISQETEDKRLEGIVLNLLGNLHITLDKIDEAIEFLEDSMILIQETNNKGEEISVLLNLARAYANKYDFQKAIEILEQALEVCRTVESPLIETVQEMLNILNDSDA